MYFSYKPFNLTEPLIPWNTICAILRQGMDFIRPPQK